jgi:hypothetical protein
MRRRPTTPGLSSALRIARIRHRPARSTSAPPPAGRDDSAPPPNAACRAPSSPSQRVAATPSEFAGRAGGMRISADDPPDEQRLRHLFGHEIRGNSVRRRLSDPEVPTNLALRSVKGARLAIALVSVQGVIGRGFVDASLVGSGIGDADTGIVGVCLCWWNAEGCQCYGCCRRHAHYCPLHFSSSFPDLTPQWPPCCRHSSVVQNCCHSVPEAYEFAADCCRLLAGEGVSFSVHR